MTERRVIHAWNPEFSKARCGVEIGVEQKREGGEVTCRRCLSILSGERRVGASNRLPEPSP